MARRHVRKHYIKAAPSSWAGDRIVCAGSRSRLGEGNLRRFLAEREQQKFITSKSMNLYEFARNFYTPALPRECAEDLDSRVDHSAYRRSFIDEDYTALHTVLGLSARPIVKEVKQPRPRILRNLSRKVFVRQEALNRFDFDTKCTRPRCYRCTRIGFGHIIWMRTGSSTSSSVGMSRNPIKVHQGSWAGDRFDFVGSTDFLETDMGVDGLPVEWKDVSDEVVKDLTLLWTTSKEEYDSDED